MIHILPEKLDKKGNLGPISQDILDEQQLSGHGWLLRGLCEYYQWKKDPKVKNYIQGILNNLALPTKGYHKNYPISPGGRISNTGGMAGSSANVVNNWKLSTDVGCDFIFRDGVVQAYGLFPSPELKALIDEMVSRYLEMNLVGIKAQSHATLTGLRAALMYSQITGEKELLSEVSKRYQIYHEQAMTENYENYNWFERPDWTEPCAIVDSYLLAVQLWQYTQSPEYLEDAQLIYYNAIGHTQRSNGGFGCDNCAGTSDNALFVKADEAYWCCTMHGGEGLSKAMQYSYFTRGDTLIIPSFNSGSVRFNLNGCPFRKVQQTNYPFDNKVLISIGRLNKPVRINLVFFAPSWIQDLVISKNNELADFKLKRGFAEVSSLFMESDTIEYSFSMKAGVKPVLNPLHYSSGNSRLFYGPLLLGYEGVSDVDIPMNAVIAKTDQCGFKINGTDIMLSTVYHFMDPRVNQSSGCRKQILF